MGLDVIGVWYVFVDELGLLVVLFIKFCFLVGVD